MSRTGPLCDVRVVEFAGLGPGPFAAMLLADMGADVVSVHRPGAGAADPRRFTERGRARVEIDLKSAQGRDCALALLERADMLIEGFRPGVMEGLGLGPDDVLARNRGLIYGRITGWGQSGPLATLAGHDINYIAITGALDAVRGGDGAPVAPLNLVGDYGGGSLYLVMGMLAALHERRRSGLGQVIDAAIVDGALSLLTPTFSFKARGQWSGPPGSNLLDGGAFFYQTYECADGRWLAIGAAEEEFYRLFRRLAGIDDPAFDRQCERREWPRLRHKLRQIFHTRAQAEWMSRFEGTDACVSPVLSLEEAPMHPHLRARQCFMEHAGYLQPAPAPRLSRTPLGVPSGSRTVDAADVLADWRSAGTGGA